MDSYFFHRKSAATSPAAGLADFQARADQGDADAQFVLGLYYSSASGEVLDFVQAARWYRRAADQDHALAKFNLGVMFARGQGMPRDDAIAADWMRKAAEGGDAGGQYNFGVRCHRASMDPDQAGAAESRIEACKWLRLAAKQGYAGSHTASELVILGMSWAEVDESNLRVAAFAVGQVSSVKLP